MRFPVDHYVSSKLRVRSRSEGHHGTEFVCDCILCGGRSKLYVNESTGNWICYKCDQRGRLTRLVEILEDISTGQALRFIFEAIRAQPSRPLSALSSQPEEEPEKEPVVLPPEFIPVRSESGWEVPLYLTGRGVSPKVAARYGLGFCEQGRYAGRIILPAHVNGELGFFQARSILPSIEPKYLAPRADRSAALWGYDEAVAMGANYCFVVEGPFDVLACAGAGLPAVGLMGKVVSPTQAALLRARFDGALILLDADARKDAVKAARMLGEAMKAMVVDLPKTISDPGSAKRSELQALAEDALLKFFA